jgi:hypothetical protein
MAGEMSIRDIQKGGDHYEWSQMIKFAALSLMRKTHRRIMLREMRPFDVYQGPYAKLNRGRLWSISDGVFYYEGVYFDTQGSIQEIAQEINKVLDAQPVPC